jgi:uncharacterized protein YndB with AHSA1/START domain
MPTSTTILTQFIRAPRQAVYAALIDGGAVGHWMTPDDMTSHVHTFDGREGGAFRISLTYHAPDAVGKTTAHTDTYSGRFISLVPNERVVETMVFETEDPAMRGEMTVTLTLADVAGGTELCATHADVPPGITPADNELGWRLSLAKLARLLEAGQAT